MVIISPRRRVAERLLLTLVCTISACVAVPVAAFATNTSATRVYLRASEAYAQSEESQIGAIVAAMNAREGEVAAGCPGALAYAPRDSSFESLTEELGISDWYAELAPMRQQQLRSAAAIGGLHWSDRRITKLVRSEAAEERGDAALVLPDVCAAIVTWREGAYAALPASVTAFLTHVEALSAGSTIGRAEEQRETVILHLLARYEDPAEKRFAGRVMRLMARVEKRVVAAGDAANRRLAAAMGVVEL